MINAITVDLEDWYHICGIEHCEYHNKWYKYHDRLEKNVDKILKLFAEHDVKATFFVVGFIAEKAPELIKRIADEGHEIASHGFYHRRIFDMSPEEFESDLLRSKRVIEKASNKKVLGYRAPEWSLKEDNVWALDILKKHGFKYDASAVPLSHLSGKHFGVQPSQIATKYGNIIEFPLNTFRAGWERLPFSGGLPMRIVPYFYILKTTILLNRKGCPVMFYIHPWEFERDCVEIDLPFNRKFMHYCNIKSTPRKLKMLLKHLRFSTVKEVLSIQEKNDKTYVRNRVPLVKYIDSAYVYSACLTYALLLTILVILFSVTLVIKFYSIILVILFCTIWYWPWGVLFKISHSLQPKKEIEN